MFIAGIDQPGEPAHLLFAEAGAVVIVLDDRGQIEGAQVAEPGQPGEGRAAVPEPGPGAVGQELLHLRNVGQLAVDLEVGPEVAGKVDAEATGAAVAGIGEQIDVRVPIEQGEFACQVEVVPAAKIRVHPLPHRQGGHGQGHDAQVTLQAADRLRFSHDKAFHGLFRVVGILGPVEEAHRVPGIALAPFKGFLARRTGQGGGGRQAQVGFVDLGRILPALVVALPGGVELPVHAGRAAAGRPVQAQPACQFVQGRLRVVVEVEPGQGRTLADVHVRRTSLDEPADLQVLSGKAVRIERIDLRTARRSDAGKHQDERTGKDGPPRPWGGVSAGHRPGTGS